MRDKLMPLLRNRPLRYVARFGNRSRTERVGLLTLLNDVRLLGGEEVLTDHVWIRFGKEVDTQKWANGAEVRFRAKVAYYLKGYLGRDESGIEGIQEEDLNFVDPTEVRLANQREEGQTSLD